MVSSLLSSLLFYSCFLISYLIFFLSHLLPCCTLHHFLQSFSLLFYIYPHLQILIFLLSPYYSFLPFLLPLFLSSFLPFLLRSFLSSFLSSFHLQQALLGYQSCSSWTFAERYRFHALLAMFPKLLLKHLYYQVMHHDTFCRHRRYH